MPERNLPWQASPWTRWFVVQLVQLPALALILFVHEPAALWLAALYGSVVCCCGTDSGGRWLNRALVVQAICWLLLPAWVPLAQ